MKIRYDPDADALYIQFRDDKVEYSKELDENTIVDYNKENQLVGMEILFVREKNPFLLKELQFENLVPA